MTSRKREGEAATPAASDSALQKPSKRVRKAINCEPCRASKLKCDRGRPCSGCVLRGTTAQCYPDEERGPPPLQDHKKEEATLSLVDVRTEVGRIRKSLAILESLVPREGSFSAFLSSSSFQGILLSLMKQYDLTPTRPKEGGLYLGPTAPCSAVLTLRSDETGSPVQSETLAASAIRALRSPHANADIRSEIPTDFVYTTSLITFFFTRTSPCPPIDHNAFSEAWARARGSDYTDHLVMATLFLMLAVAVYYLPPRDPLLARLPAPPNVVANRWYNASLIAANRYKKFKNPPDLDWIEMLLLKAQFLSISGADHEEIWGVKCEIGSAALAMALHRDPGAWKMDLEEIQRRRWVWWNYVVLERWLSFLFGRPLAVRSDHFDTKYPVSDATPSRTATGSSQKLVVNHPSAPLSHLFALAQFRLAAIIGEVVSDATSVKPVPYDRVKELDKSLEDWESMLPEIPYNSNMDRYGIGINGNMNRGNLDPFELRTLTLWKVHLRVQMFHVRFIMHRPYMNSASLNGSDGAGAWSVNGRATAIQGPGAQACPPPHSGSVPPYTDGSTEGSTSSVVAPSTTPSYEAALHSAEMVIQLVSDASIQLLGEGSSPSGGMGFLGVPGHIAWIGYSLFSASVFFVTLMLTGRSNAPSWSNTSVHYRRILAASETLKYVKAAVPFAEKALLVLYAMAPFFEDDLDDAGKKAQIDAIRTLAFPGHKDPPLPLHKPDNGALGDLSAHESLEAELERDLDSRLETHVPSKYDGHHRAIAAPNVPPPQQNVISPVVRAPVEADELPSMPGSSMAGRATSQAFTSTEPASIYGTPDRSTRPPSSMRSPSEVSMVPYHLQQQPNSFLNPIVMGPTDGVSSPISGVEPPYNVPLNGPFQIADNSSAEMRAMPPPSTGGHTARNLAVPTSQPSAGSHSAMSAPPALHPSQSSTEAMWYPQNRLVGSSQKQSGSGMGLGMAVGPGMGMVISPQPKVNQPPQYFLQPNAAPLSGPGTYMGHITPPGIAGVAMGPPSAMDVYVGYIQRTVGDEVWEPNPHGSSDGVDWADSGSSQRQQW
ncbi:uncharacterized protein EI90DRAFT_3048299 [Cantharellus anzutake]|uniref:uncharacterized protein n=1 Tax=Cantharellus anzutake TaxID=1750568 RepID=UPI0019070E67|nr:uncharacterized protein EI90DRAFT_3048299 [Cantharellus anzutake]KAF8335413.1 hypothetical protein EI90DRAFT_3048299 [Cantharellus anzutake]